MIFTVKDDSLCSVLLFKGGLKVTNNNNNNNNNNVTNFIAPNSRNSSNILTKNIAKESGLCNATSNIHNVDYPKQITQKLKLLNPRPCSVCSNAESSNT